MLESIFIAILVITIIFQLVALVWNSPIFTTFTIVLYLILAVNVLYIEVPYVVVADGVVHTGTQTFYDIGKSVFLGGLAFVNVILLIVQLVALKKENEAGISM